MTPSPYRTILGEQYDALHPNVRRAHEAPLVADGTFVVVHGTDWMVPVLIALMKLPASGHDVPVALSVASELVSGNEQRTRLHWHRQIGRTPLVTRQHAGGPFLVEESGPARVVFSLRVEDGCLLYEHARLHFLFVRLPSLLSPRIRARVAPAPAGWHVEVVIEWRGHLICRYAGTMRPREATV
jgi:hypothetical protein